MKQKVGKIKQLIYNDETDSLELVIEVVDKKFQKKLLRDLTFSGNLTVEGDSLVYLPSEENVDGEISVPMPRVSGDNSSGNENQ